MGGMRNYNYQHLNVGVVKGCGFTPSSIAGSSDIDAHNCGSKLGAGGRGPKNRLAMPPVNILICLTL